MPQIDTHFLFIFPGSEAGALGGSAGSLLRVSQDKIKMSAGLQPFLDSSFKRIDLVGRIQALEARGLESPFPPRLSSRGRLHSCLIVLPSLSQQGHVESFSWFESIQLFLLLHLSDSSQRKSSAFKGWCDWIGPIQIIHSNLPIVRSITLIKSAKSFCYNMVTGS